MNSNATINSFLC